MRNLLRLLFPRRWRPGPCYREMRAAAERTHGDLSLPGERATYSEDTRTWPQHGCPCDEPLEDAAEQLRMRTGHA